MARKRLPFTQLQAFEAVARLGSFKEASAELNGSKVSNHCTALENSLGVKLLNRSPRGTLTREGKYLAMILTHTFDHLADALSSVEQGQLDVHAIYSILASEGGAAKAADLTGDGS